MAIDVVAKGTWVAGNNTALTPIIPSGGQTNDTVFCLGYVRENGATLACTAGWSLVTTYAGPSTENRMSLWSVAWTSGMGNPTVTPSGSGSNDTTLAVCFIVRGTISGTTVIASGQNTYATNETFVSNNANQASTPGDGFLCLSAAAAALSTYGTPNVLNNNATFGPYTETSGIFWSSDQSSTLGADASVHWAMLQAPATLNGTTDFWIFRNTYNANRIWALLKFDSTPPPIWTANLDLLIGWRGSYASGSFYDSDSFLDIVIGAEIDVGEVLDNTQIINLDTAIGATVGITEFAAPAIYEANGFSAAWDAPATPLGPRYKQTVSVKLNGNSVPVKAITLRRDLDKLRVNVEAVGWIAGTIGQSLVVNIVVTPTSGPPISIEAVNCVVSGIDATMQTTAIYGEAAMQPPSGVWWEPKKVLYSSSGRTRTEVDWFVRPGDVYGDLTIINVVTVVGGDYWFTEVGYG